MTAVGRLNSHRLNVLADLSFILETFQEKGTHNTPVVQ